MLKEDLFEHFQNHFDDASVFAVTVCGFKMRTSEQIDGIKLGKWHRGKLRTTENILNNEIASRKLSPPFYSFSVQGAYFFADTKKLKELKGFDEIYSPFLMEETDLAYRALKKNWKIIYEPKCRAWHQIGSSIKSVAGNSRVKMISTRNQLIFTWKNIHSPNLLVSHFLFLFLRLIMFNLVAWRGLLRALPNIGAVLKKRRHEIQSSVKTDNEILKYFDQCYRTGCGGGQH
jgi:GT2 family glycosyltransferase